VNW
jgi:SAM-dependent methyltransferase